MRIHESAEDYLEIILVLQRQKGAVRAVDIARELNYSKPSVSIAIKNLKAENLITVDENHEIRLTERGREIAVSIYERHVFISDFLTKIGVEHTRAVKEACRIEHVISQETFEILKRAILDPMI